MAERLTPRAAATAMERGAVLPDGADERVTGYGVIGLPFASGQVEILLLVARGASNKEIAAQLVLSEKTVRNHVERTYAKLGVKNRVGASLYALEAGLVAPA